VRRGVSSKTDLKKEDVKSTIFISNIGEGWKGRSKKKRAGLCNANYMRDYYSGTIPS